jgi:hypothetical protein
LRGFGSGAGETARHTAYVDWIVRGREATETARHVLEPRERHRTAITDRLGRERDNATPEEEIEYTGE